MVDMEIITLINERFKSLDDSIKSFRDESKTDLDEVKADLRVITDDKAKQQACIDGMKKDQADLKARLDKTLKYYIGTAVSLFVAYATVPQDALSKLIAIITKAFGGS